MNSEVDNDAHRKHEIKGMREDKRREREREREREWGEP